MVNNNENESMKGGMRADILQDYCNNLSESMFIWIYSIYKTTRHTNTFIISNMRNGCEIFAFLFLCNTQRYTIVKSMSKASTQFINKTIER